MAETSDNSGNAKRQELWDALLAVTEIEWNLIQKNRIAEKKKDKINKKNINAITNKKIVKKEKKKIVIKSNRQEDQELVREPPMPAPMRREIGRMAAIGENPIWVVNKRLTDSDVKPNLSRLFIPTESKLEGLLSAEEKQRMRVEGKNKAGNLKTKMVDGEGGVWDLDFKHWTSINKYVFTNQWIQFVQRFGVKEGWIVQIWCFRNRDSHLCFGINVQHN